MIHANFVALCFIDPALLPIEFYIAGIIFDLFASVTLSLTR